MRQILILLLASLTISVGVTGILMADNGSPDIVGETSHYRLYHNSDHYQDDVARIIRNARSILIPMLKDSLSYVPNIYICNNIQEFRSLVGSTFPDWGAAAALPYKEMIVMKSPGNFRLGKSFRELLTHEYAHLALSHRLFNAHGPRWLDEGVAMYTAVEWGWENNFAMSKAVVFHSLIPLSEIDDMNRFSQSKAQIAYAESYLAVKYFIDVYGLDLFNLFLDGLRERKSVDEALMVAINGNMAELEKEFNKYLKNRYNYMSLLGDMYFLWIFLAVVVFAGFILNFFRKKKHYKKWEEDELLQSTDFDYGDPDNPEQVDDEDEPWR